MRRNADDLVSHLRSEGMRFSSFSLVSQGEYAPSDAEWNYKDVPHLNIIHPLVNTVLADVQDDSIATVNFQKVAGIIFPMAVYNFSVSENTQSYFTTMFGFILVVEARYEETGTSGSRVTTTYHVGSSRVLRSLHPVIRWLLKKNYVSLADGDVPMRERRGWLRKRGYSFAGDVRGHSFLRSMRLADQNVICPEAEVSASGTYDVVTGAGPIFHGESDHLGLRFERVNGELQVFPRMCTHEGACLDGSNCEGGHLECPWHARRVAPLGHLKLGLAHTQIVETPHHRVKLDGQRLTVEPLDAEV